MTTIDGRLALTLPEQFLVYEIEELQAAYSIDYANMWGARDETNHVAITFIWKDSNELLTKLASEKSLAKRSEKSLAKTYRKRDYRLDGFFETQIAGKQAHGFRYAFRDPAGTMREAETLVFKDGERCYTLYYYTYAELAAENQPIHDSIFASMALQ